MQVKKYFISGHTFTDPLPLGRFIRQSTGKSFANPQDDAGWQALGVLIHTEEVEEPQPVEPSAEEKQAQIQKEMTDKVQAYLDKEAQALGYDSCLSVCSYVSTGVQKFDDEGTAFREWRSKVWEKGYAIVAAVKAGERQIPTEEELFAELPKLAVVYSAEG